MNTCIPLSKGRWRDFSWGEGIGHIFIDGAGQVEIGKDEIYQSKER